MHDLEPELIEPSYPRAFRYISANLKKRAFVVILTDLVDKESFKAIDNIRLKLLRPRHLPLVATIGDRDLNATVSEKPKEIKDVFTQSAAEEIIHQREAALQTGRNARRFGFGRYNSNPRAAAFGNLSCALKNEGYCSLMSFYKFGKSRL